MKNLIARIDENEKERFEARFSGLSKEEKVKLFTETVDEEVEHILSIDGLCVFEEASIIGIDDEDDSITEDSPSLIGDIGEEKSAISWALELRCFPEDWD